MMGISTLQAIGRAAAAESTTTINGTANVAIIAISIVSTTVTIMTAASFQTRIR